MNLSSSLDVDDRLSLEMSFRLFVAFQLLYLVRCSSSVHFSSTVIFNQRPLCRRCSAPHAFPLVRSQSAFFKRRPPPPPPLLRGREHHQKFIVAGNLDVSGRSNQAEKQRGRETEPGISLLADSVA